MKQNLEKYIISGILIILTFSLIFAETKQVEDNFRKLENADTTFVAEADSILADSLQAATQDSVFYAADSTHYSFLSKRIELAGAARLTYHTSVLKSDTIAIDMQKRQAFTLGQSVLEDGEYLLLGEEISYDMRSQWGMIRDGATRFEQGYCYGDEIRKIAEETFDVDNAIFTTCDALHPHFYIKASKLRLYKDDKIVAKPLIFYVNHLPVFALPFGTFTIKRGRESGFLVPSPSYNSVDGKILRDIAYYQVFGPYADATLSLDYYENTGWEAALKSRYIKRYMFNGDFEAILLKQISQLKTKYEWNISSVHHQDFVDDSTFDARLHFVSSTSVWDNSEDLEEREQEEISSALAYKRPLWGRTLSVTANYTDNLVDKIKYLRLPSVAYSLPSKPIYELFYNENDKIPDYAWWKDFSYSYSLRAVHEGYISDPDATWPDVLYQTAQDSSGAYINQHNAGVKHNIGISYNHKIRGWLDLGQTANLNEVWFDRDQNYQTNQQLLVRGSDYSLNSSVGFSLYGLGDFPGEYVQAVRHVISPNFSFTFRPDFSENEKYYSFSGIGLNSSAKQRRFNFSLANKWDLKLRKAATADADSAEDAASEIPTEKLNNFFKLSSSLNYDLENEEEGFSNISHSLSMNLKDYKLGFITLGTNPSGAISQDTYALKFSGWDHKSWDYAVENWSVTLNSKLSLSGQASYTDYFPRAENRFESNKFFTSDSLDISSEDLALTLDILDEMQQQDKSWSLNFNHYYQTNKASYEQNKYTSNLRSSLSAKITDNWEISYNNYINLKTKEIASHNLTLSRDLHCWKIVFTYSYSSLNDYWNYRFQLFNIKLPNELKFRTSGHK
ncbi:MAG: putative LPS assembly protein LptD [Candidatus Cloacimonadales bacterium]